MPHVDKVLEAHRKVMAAHRAAREAAREEALAARRAALEQAAANGTGTPATPADTTGT